ncbi:hypothetical protein [Anabaena sp. PCC 7108]|uniref:hypothetical protein n=1 Tax=Anabaena sp. PCC 7108 TaxID=163908 RepID=UPI00034BAB59|nr:hypothetical protein [Anabaena sp. PCC 7108]
MIELLPSHTLRFAEWLDTQLPQPLPLHTLRFAEWLDDQDLEVVEFAAAPVGYFVDKQGRWRDKRTGRFVDMPVSAKNAALGRQVIKDVNESKLLQLQGADAYNATLSGLRAKYKNNPDALKIISDLGLEKGVSNRVKSKQQLIRASQALREDATLEKELAGRVAAMKPERARAVVDDVEKLKLLQLSGADAYNATVQRLRRKYKDDPEALNLIDSLGVDGGVGRKAQVDARLERVRKLIPDDEPAVVVPESEPVLNHELRKVEVKSTAVTDDSARLDGVKQRLDGVDVTALSVDEKKQYERDQTAYDAVVGYRKSVEDLNKLVDQVNGKGSMTSAEYDQFYKKRDAIWERMKGSLDESQGLKDEFLSDPAMDEYLKKMQGISRENPGGYKINVPGGIDGVKEQAKKLPC